MNALNILRRVWANKKVFACAVGLIIPVFALAHWKLPFVIGFLLIILIGLIIYMYRSNIRVGGIALNRQYGIGIVVAGFIAGYVWITVQARRTDAIRMRYTAGSVSANSSMSLSGEAWAVSLNGRARKVYSNYSLPAGSECVIWLSGGRRGGFELIRSKRVLDAMFNKYIQDLKKGLHPALKDIKIKLGNNPPVNFFERAKESPLPNKRFGIKLKNKFDKPLPVVFLISGEGWNGDSVNFKVEQK